MKYFEVIYNSSQHTKNGNVGFGIRTTTEGIPEEYIQLLEEKGIFSYDPGSCQPITPKSLLDNPEKILTMPRGYTYTKIPVSPEKSIYVLARKIAVGFDYTYYLSFQAGRLGNYVTHCFIFPEKPDATIFQLLYENPATGNLRFLPESPVPSPDNEGMKELSLGEQPPLKMENKDFTAAQLRPVSREAMDILFAYIEAKNIGKPLLVRLDESKTAPVIADIYRLFPQELISDITFCTNHQDEGIKKGYEIFFINQHYQFEVYKNQVFYLEEGAGIQTKETDIFRNIIEKHLTENNFAEIHNIVGWLLSDGYRLVKDKSIETNQAFYNYYKQNDLFKIDLLKTNPELKETLSTHIRTNIQNGSYLFKLIENLFMDSRTTEDWNKAVQTVKMLEDAQINMDSVINNIKSKFTYWMLLAVSDLADCMKKIDFNQLKRYFDKTQFIEKLDYLDSPQLLKYWAQLYPYFYTNPKTELDKIVKHTIDVKLNPTEQDKIFSEIEPDKEKRLKTYLSILKTDPDYFDKLWRFIEKEGKDTNLSKIFSEQEENSAFAPLFYHSVKTTSFNKKTAVERIEYLAFLSNKNQGFSKLIKENFKKDNIYGKLFEDFKNEISPDNYPIDILGHQVIEPLARTSDVSNWIMLQNLMEGITEECNAKDIAQYWQLAKELKDKKFLDKLIPVFIKVNKDNKQIETFVKDVLRYLKHDQHKITDRIENLSEKEKLEYYKYIFRIQKTPMEEIMTTLTELKVKKEKRKSFLEENFPKEYKKYKRTQGIKKFLHKIFPFLKKKKEV